MEGATISFFHFISAQSRSHGKKTYFGSATSPHHMTLKPRLFSLYKLTVYATTASEPSGNS